MSNMVLNEKRLNVFLIIAQTIDGWKNPTTEEGKKVLMEHYAWGAALKSSGKLLLAGPVDTDLFHNGTMNPLGKTTGLIMLKVDSRAEAEEWAFKDPFHLHGFRKNEVHSMVLSMTDDALFNPLENVLS
jgi:uncharacterized protein YciI